MECKSSALESEGDVSGRGGQRSLKKTKMVLKLARCEAAYRFCFPRLAFLVTRRPRRKMSMCFVVRSASNNEARARAHLSRAYRPPTMVSSPSTPFAKPMSREIMGHKKKVHSVAWNSVGRKLASGSVDQSARVFDVEHGVQAGKEIELKGHSDSVDQVSWDPTAVDRLATISADKSLRLWDLSLIHI